LFVALLAFTCCEESGRPSDEQKVFVKLLPGETGIDFTNTLILKEDFDVFRYRNYYNGGGVGIADFNNDGLADVYLTSNMETNRLYLNLGNFKFSDITQKAGVGGNKVWSTGVAIADVNADGWLDIYVCNSGDPKGRNRENELYINNGDLTFSERAAEYGLADVGFSTHAVFIDYDKDGDLDCYVLNNSFRPISTLGYRNLREVRDEMGGDRFYRNDNGKFTDITVQAGIYSSVIGFGLGVTAGDVNGDNWPDLYISNDFYERDYLYINNHDGTFTEDLENRMGHISMFSMGADLADLNNDGHPEIFSTDMLPEEEYRLKTMTDFESYDVYQVRLKNGYYHQFMRNMLHANMGNGQFTELGEMTGLAATDWSWSALMADFNNDGYKEIFVGNGIYKDVTNLDFIDFFSSNEQIKAASEGKKIDFKEFVDRMPSTKLSNYLFERVGTWKYLNKAHEYGLDEPSFSNGAAYGDLDNDGDLDLIVNNVNQPTWVYKNLTREKTKGNFISIQLKGSGGNNFGIGASVKLFVKGEVLYYEQIPMRGFQSSMDYKLVAGLGENTKADSLRVTWPDDKTQLLLNVVANQNLALHYSDAQPLVSRLPAEPAAKPYLSPVVGNISHNENDFNDFDRDRLLYFMNSTQGPALAVADLNNDGFDDMYLGGSVGFPGKIFLQRANFTFEEVFSITPDDALADDTDAGFFDADGDGDLDLYVVTGGSEVTGNHPALLDRFYENTGIRSGKPVFRAVNHKIPPLYASGSCVRPADVDGDGDLDLFVGTRLKPGYYGLSCDQYILINDGKGNFTDATTTFAPVLLKAGMITDARWFDYDTNGFPDLVMVGDWLPVKVFLNDGKKLTEAKTVKGLSGTNGWWNVVRVQDINQDGRDDLLVGNLGKNSTFKPSTESPISLYVNDFDNNGSIEPIFTYQRNGKEYPKAFKKDLIKQMSSLKKRFLYYKDYAGKPVTDVFSKNLLDKAEKKVAYLSASGVFINQASGGFTFTEFPPQAQLAPVYAIELADITGDGATELLLGGNLYRVKPEVGRLDGNAGVVLNYTGSAFTVQGSALTGFSLKGETRHINVIKSGKKKMLICARNNDSMLFFRIN
jgi:hypothetical protein